MHEVLSRRRAEHPWRNGAVVMVLGEVVDHAVDRRLHVLLVTDRPRVLLLPPAPARCHTRTPAPAWEVRSAVWGGCGITRVFLLPYATRPSLNTPIPASHSEESCGHAGVASPATHRRAPRPPVVDRGHRRALGGSQRRPTGQRPTVVGATQRDPGQAAPLRLRSKGHGVSPPTRWAAPLAQTRSPREGDYKNTDGYKSLTSGKNCTFS